MEWLTEDALLICDHGGRVNNKLRQEWVTIMKRKVMVSTDPEGRSISGCPNANVIKGDRPCVTTLPVKQGYSDFIRIDGNRVCLSTVRGLTDGTLPGTVNYYVVRPGQDLLDSKS